MSQPVWASGFLLRAVPHGDADLVTTWLTAEFGKVTAFARAARGSKKRFAGALSTLTLARLQLVPTAGEMWRLTTAEVEHSFVELGADLVAVAYAAYACELAQEFTVAGHAEPEMFGDLLAVHQALAAHALTPVGLRWYELRALDLHGSLPELEDLMAMAGAAAQPELGRDFEPWLVALLAASTLEEAGRLPANSASVMRLRDVLATLISRVVNKPLQSVIFLQKMNAGLRRTRADN